MKSRRVLLTAFVASLCGTQVSGFAEVPAKQRIGLRPRNSGSQVTTAAFLLPGNDVTREGRMSVIGGGVTITVGEIGEALEMSADRAVILGSRQPDGNGYDTEIYLEGDVVFENGRDRVFANRLYYNVTDGVKVITDVDIMKTVGQVETDSHAESVRAAIREIATRSPGSPKKADLHVGDKVALTFNGDLVSLFRLRHAGAAHFVDLQPEPAHVQVVGTVVRQQPNGDLLIESASMPITFAKRSCLQKISGLIHPSRIQSRSIRGEDLESLTIVMKEREQETQGKKIDSK